MLVAIPFVLLKFFPNQIVQLLGISPQPAVRYLSIAGSLWLLVFIVLLPGVSRYRASH